jgi:cytochrome P450
MAVKFVRENRDQSANDILSLMINENLKTEVDGDRLSEQEMVNQVAIFLAAGHETTSLGVCP